MTQEEMQKIVMEAIASGKMQPSSIVLGDEVKYKIDKVEPGAVVEQNNYYGSDGILNRQDNKMAEGSKTYEERIFAVYNANLCRSKADWGIVFRLLRELGRFKPTEYYDCAELINSACGEKVTDEDGIRLSKANLSLKGSYKTGWQDTSPTVQTESLLKRYNEIAAVFMQD